MVPEPGYEVALFASIDNNNPSVTIDTVDVAENLPEFPVKLNPPELFTLLSINGIINL